MFTRKFLHKMKLIQDPSCPHCPGITESRIHRFWKCPKAAAIWSFIKEVLKETCLPPVFIKEAMLGDYENNPTSCNNLVILYTKWYIDQAKREAEAPKTITYVAALLNVMSAQLEFINTRYSQQARSRAAAETNKINFFLHNPNRLRKDIRLM